MKKLRKLFIEEIKKADLFWLYIVSTLSLFGLCLMVYSFYSEPKQDYIPIWFVYVAISFTFVFLSTFIFINIKRRALYDPNLNIIKIQSVKDMGKYLNRMFLVEFDSPSRYRMYLQSVELRQEDKIFIYLEPLDIDFIKWEKEFREMLGNQSVAAVTFIKEPEGHRIGIKFWTFSSSVEKVIFAGKIYPKLIDSSQSDCDIYLDANNNFYSQSK